MNHMLIGEEMRTANFYLYTGKRQFFQLQEGKEQLTTEILGNFMGC